jgi:hypothetical protein
MSISCSLSEETALAEVTSKANNKPTPGDQQTQNTNNGGHAQGPDNVPTNSQTDAPPVPPTPDILRALRENLVVSVELAGRALGIGRNSAYQAVRQGQLPCVRIGRRIAVPTAPLRALLGI